MKNTIPISLPTFHGLTIKYPYTFLFEFRTYDYLIDAQKLKLFPSTLKDSTLRWFMGLEGNILESWEQMKQTLIEKYRDYCKARNTRGENFRMTEWENESLGDYEERF